MKTLTKSALSVAIVAAMAATSVQAEQFVDDSTLNIHLRNYYKQDSQENAGNVKSSQNKNKQQWSQAIRADFKSGYFADLVGVDLSTHYALKLDSKGNTGLLQGSGSNSKSESYGKSFGAVKVNLMDNGVAKYGRMELDTPLLNESDSRSLPSTTEAFYADYSMAGVTVFGAIAKKGNSKTESGYEDYVDNNGKKKSVKTVGASYEANGLSLTAAYAKQNDVAKSLYAEAGYSLPISDGMTLALGAQYGKNSSAGDTKDLANSFNLKTSIKWHGLKAALTVNDLKLSLSMTDVGGGNNNAWTDAAVGWSGGDDSTNFNGYNSVQIGDFYDANETSYQVRADYDFSDMIVGLSAHARYVTGEIDNSGKADDADTSELDLQVSYAVPALDGLTVKLRHGIYEKDPSSTATNNATYTKKDTRVIVTYDLAVF